MAQPPNYMDGVPVKISEKYKPPPKVSLPSSIIQRLSNLDSTNRISNYDFSLETNVIIKINEWKVVRDLEQNERKERIRLREEERLRKIEEKQKQMLTDVSYPNAADLSSDEEVTVEIKPEEKQYTTTAGHFSPPKCFNTILTPTVVPGLVMSQQNEPTTSSDRPQSYNNYKSVNSNLSKINYSDFENDTSSPFDNMELKTINDLDILAQVLNNSAKIHSDNLSSTNNIVVENTNNLKEHGLAEDEINDDNKDKHEVIVNENIQNSNNFYNQPVINIDNTQQYNTANYNQINEINFAPTFNYNNQNEHSNIYTDINGYYFNQNQNYVKEYNSYIGQQLQYEHIPVTQHNYTNINNTNNIKLKSKSVPDILKELNDELKDSEMKRTRNNSQSITTPDDDPSDKAAYLPKKKTTDDDNLFKKLPRSSQHTAKTISLMGFELNRVSRITQLIGNDDKKIVEHLIPLSELLDLGFDENKISDALIKFNNNKDKALDYLIS